MDEEAVSTYFATDSIGYFNSSEFITKPPLVEETNKWTDAEIARFIHITVRPILLVFGSTGNCLSFYIMRRTSLKNISSCFYMSILALADTSK